jgi:hypothetical protein
MFLCNGGDVTRQREKKRAKRSDHKKIFWDLLLSLSSPSFFRTSHGVLRSTVVCAFKKGQADATTFLEKKRQQTQKRKRVAFNVDVKNNTHNKKTLQKHIICFFG